MKVSTSQLAIHGGEKAVTEEHPELFKWPIVTEEDEKAVLEVLRAGSMSGLEVTKKLEEEFSVWLGTKYALGHNNGTASVHSAMFGCGVGVGDEIIGPSVTYWAAVLPALSLGASIVFADIEEDTLCIDPEDIEHRITERTKAIVVVHNHAMVAKMDRIMDIANRHGIKVIEDVSHAQGSLYKGKKAGTFGHVAALSCMAGKSLAWGEAGMLATNDRKIYERAIALGHYARHYDKGIFTDSYLEHFSRLPWGGYKYRMNQTCAAMGRVQLRHYDERIKVIQKAMNYFWDLLEGVPGIQAHRPEKDSGSTMGGWYAPLGFFHSEQLEDLPIERFCEAIRAEGVTTGPGINFSLHLHPLLHDCDIYGHGKPTVIAHASHDTRQGKGSLPVSERISERCFSVPWFKRYWPEIIEKYALAFRKVCEHAHELK